MGGGNADTTLAPLPGTGERERLCVSPVFKDGVTTEKRIRFVSSSNTNTGSLFKREKSLAREEGLPRTREGGKPYPKKKIFRQDYPQRITKCTRLLWFTGSTNLTLSRNREREGGKEGGKEGMMTGGREGLRELGKEGWRG